MSKPKPARGEETASNVTPLRRGGAAASTAQPPAEHEGIEYSPDKQAALDYHEQGRPGKLEVVPTKPMRTQRDLSLAYTPGVAEPCREIAKDQTKVGLYTARRNLVAVVSNGTAVLGLGDIGPYAAKPVMEGKAVLFKRFADIDVFDLELNAKDPELLIETVAALEPTFGGINLEDIKAPECFIVEKALKLRMGIPVFHDDQHGTAIITAAALLNAAEMQSRPLSSLEIVCVGAGASAIACMDLWIKLGVDRERITMIDSRGIIRDGRSGVDAYKAPFARAASDPRRTLADALKGADVLIGLSSGGRIPSELIAGMAKNPLIFVLANPDPEIPYEDCVRLRPDAIVATGRSDYPNQVNNVLGFPFIFRGALDVAATSINEEMKLAAAHALATLAREPVPDAVKEAYGGEDFSFGPRYIIPKPVDVRVLTWVSSAVAKAAMATGVAQERIDLEVYKARLEARALYMQRDRLVHQASS
ncbi:MAG TPA: malic enzyme-like NAD(P)-binding protein [Polyangiales bacterium]